jgi:hypothetical protein
VIMSNVDFVFPLFLTNALILFFSALPASSMITDAMVSWLLRIFASLCSYDDSFFCMCLLCS